MVTMTRFVCGIHLGTNWCSRCAEPDSTLRRASQNVGELAFSPDGSRLYASYWPRPLRVWSVSTNYPADVRELVARLRREYPLTADLWRHIKNDTALDEAQRATALRLCSWRSDWCRALREKLWGPVVHSSDSVSERKLLLQRAEDVYDALPWNVEAWTILGAAQYRNGLYEEGVRTLARASAVACDDPRADAFLAMAFGRLGQARKAREALGRVQKANGVRNSRQLFSQQARGGLGVASPKTASRPTSRGASRRGHTSAPPTSDRRPGS